MATFLLFEIVLISSRQLNGCAPSLGIALGGLMFETFPAKMMIA
jgi:hypothetical protein